MYGTEKDDIKNCIATANGVYSQTRLVGHVISTAATPCEQAR